MRFVSVILSFMIAAAPLAYAGDPATTGSIAANPAIGSALGTKTNLPIPRFVSLKPSDTPMREGPSKDHAIKWIFKREGLPVEITAEFDNWRRVRDAEGAEGWVYQTRLSGKRTVMVMSRNKSDLVTLHKSPSQTSAVPARLEPGVIANLDNCNKNWCMIKGEGFNGYIAQDKLWGVYSAEVVK
jgi:SH3-like domain-containing protein